MAGLGYGVPAGLGVGRPRTEYIESVPLGRAIYDGSKEDRRSRRSGAIQHLTEGKTSHGLVFGSNATLHGPIYLDPKKETRCHDLVKIWDDKIGNGMETDVARDANNAANLDSDNLKVMLDFLENEPDAFDTMMCLGMTQAPAATCVTHPHFRYDMAIDGKEDAEGKKYDGFLAATLVADDPATAGDETVLHDPSATATIKQCADADANNANACGGDVTLPNNRHYYARTEDGKDLADGDDEDIEDFADGDWKPCEMRSREECGDSKTYHIVQGVQDTKIKECVMSSPRPTTTLTADNEPPVILDGDFDDDVAIAEINPYLVASVQYLVEKTGVDFNKVMCRYVLFCDKIVTRDLPYPQFSSLSIPILHRYYGNSNGAGSADAGLNHLYGAANRDCEGAITEGTPGVYTRNVGAYASGSANLADVDYKDDKQDVGVDDLSKTQAGGKDFMTFARHDQYVLYEHDGAALYRLTEEDVEFLAAYVATTYAYLLDTATRYTEEDDSGDLAAEALASRESLFANVRGDCFSPGLSGGGLLYQGGFGAAYFAFGIILIVCHLLWLMYAVTDDESKRFMATRAMSLFGILTALAGLYSTFTWPKHQCHLHPKHRFPLIHPSIPVCHQQFSSLSTAVDRAKSTTLMSSGGLRVSLAKTPTAMKPEGSLRVSTTASSQSLTTIRALPYVLEPYPTFHGSTFSRFWIHLPPLSHSPQTTATITALEALHFVFLAFAIVVPVYKASGEKGGGHTYL